MPMLTMQTTKISAKRKCLKPKVIKIYLQNTVAQKKLSVSAIISIENGIREV